MSEQRVAVVTGGAGYIGSAIVSALRDTRHDVAVIDRAGGRYAADLGSESEVRRVAAEIIQHYGRCDVLVHAAVAFTRADLAALSAETLRHVMAVNVEAALWLAEREIAVLGADNFAVEVIPFASGTVFPVHQRLIRDFGIPLLEGLLLHQLAATGRHEFLFAASPLPVVGGTGSPINPMAIL